MKPTMTIIGYLYSGRNSWLRCQEECTCPVEERIRNTLDQVLVEEYLSIAPTDDNPGGASFLLKTTEEWDDICGPKAEMRNLNDAAETLMNQAFDILAVVATKERMSSE